MTNSCPQCGLAPTPGATFCGGCGTALSGGASGPTGACPSCMAPCYPDERFCGACGTTLNAVPTLPLSDRRSRLSQLNIAAIEKCARCGADLGTGELFCANCGRSRSGAPDPAEASGSRAAGQARAAWAKILDELTAATKAEFRIIRELGRGGMAAVYLADELALNRKVAI